MPPALGELGTLLRDLGLALVTFIRSGRRGRTLENQLVMLSCLTGSDGERIFRRDWPVAPGAGRRLVVVRGPAPSRATQGRECWTRLFARLNGPKSLRSVPGHVAGLADRYLP